MADEQHRAPASAADILHLADGFFLELGVTDGQDFIDDQDLGLQMGGDGESEPHGHAGRVALDWRVDVAFTSGECDDFL